MELSAAFSMALVTSFVTFWPVTGSFSTWNRGQS